MDFARRQMEKYGWKEGQGLGRSESGIVDPIKAQYKFDKGGLGHDLGTDLTNKWWENVYNNASKNIEVATDMEGDAELRQVSEESVEITTKDYSVTKLRKKNKDMAYGSFLKTTQLTANGTVDFDIAPPEKFEAIPVLTDEQLFEACGRRTAHKGARHGLKLSGKLARIEKQERLLAKQMKSISISTNNDDQASKLERKAKKLKKERMKTEGVDVIEKPDDARTAQKKKRCKKKRKSVSFNEVVDVIAEQDDSNPSEDHLSCTNSSNISTEDEAIQLDPALEDTRKLAKDPLMSKAEKRLLKSRATTRFIYEAATSADTLSLSPHGKIKNKRGALNTSNESVPETPISPSKKEKRRKKDKKRAVSEMVVDTIADTFGEVCSMAAD